MSKKSKADKKAVELEDELKNESSNENSTEETQNENAEAQTENQTEEEETVELEPTLEQKYNELNDKYLRLSAEYDNYRKRTLKERMEMMKTAGEDILRNILPVVDNVERAQKAIAEAKEIEPIREGIDLIHKTFVDFLSQRGIKEIESLEKEFDTDLHEALTKIPAPSEELKGKVVDVIEKGYLMNDKVIRFARVVVGE